jgi:hypothetical protein
MKPPAAGPFQGWQLTSIKSAVTVLLELSDAAAAAKAACPPLSTSWAQYRKQLQACAWGEVPEAWSQEAAAAAVALITSGGIAAAGRDAAWVKAVKAAAAAQAAVTMHQKAASAADVVAHLRLQLLLFEDCLMAVTGEQPALYRSSSGPSGAWAAAVEGSGQEGDEADVQQQPDEDIQPFDEKVAETSQCVAEQQLARTGKGKYKKRSGSAAAAADNHMDVDDKEQQKATEKGHGSSKAMAGDAERIRTSSSRGSKRSAGACGDSTAVHQATKEGDESTARLPEEAGSKRARRGAEPCLPPKPPVLAGSKTGSQAVAGKNAPAATTAAAAGNGCAYDEDNGGASREGSVAPAECAAAGRGGLRIGGRVGADAAVAAAATSGMAVSKELAVTGDREHAAARSNKRARQLKSRSSKGQHVAASAAVHGEGKQATLGADDDHDDDGTSSDQNAAGTKAGQRGLKRDLKGSATNRPDTVEVAFVQDDLQQQQEADRDDLDQAGCRRRSLLHHQQCDDEGQVRYGKCVLLAF